MTGKKDKSNGIQLVPILVIVILVAIFREHLFSNLVVEAFLEKYGLFLSGGCFLIFGLLSYIELNKNESKSYFHTVMNILFAFVSLLIFLLQSM